MSRKHVFLDSGAFSMSRESRKHQTAQGEAFYRTRYFWDYVDDYAAFILKWKGSVDYYANVDTSHYPEITWIVQKYLEEEYGLKPLPVVHHGEDIEWIQKYVDAGYDYICIGGVAKTKGKAADFRPWGDRIFRWLCPESNNFLPKIKVHGFAITSVPLMCRYPWYSVDSVTWKKMSYYGQVLVPRWENNQWVFNKPPLILFMDKESSYSLREGGSSGRHFLSLKPHSKSIVKKWFKEINSPMGRRKSGQVLVPGVTNDPHWRCQATIEYFERLAKTRPKWPWPFYLVNDTAEKLHLHVVAEDHI